MDNSALLLWGMLFGLLGMGFFSYGKKQQAMVPMLTGIALFLLPYFISNVSLLIICGLILLLVPRFVRL